ncbi:MAG: FAD-dependent oxidoreductase [Planctomycetes bacterium]|nr:FAD-dependent oxidoreductase [Planctomycetota bacterium]
MPTYHHPAEDLPILAEVDVLIIGGGPAGVAAGFAAARLGAHTMIVEQHNCLGGVATAGGHGHICLYSSWGNPGWGSDELVVGGIAQEIAERVAAAGWGVFDRRNADFEVEGLKLVLERMAGECGARLRLRYHTFFSRTLVEDGRAIGAVLQSKSGRQVVLARRIVDCSGDGDAAASAGCPWEQGNAEGGCQPVTLMFQLGGVDMARVEEARRERGNDYKWAQTWKKAQEAGDMRRFQSVVMGWWWTPTRPDQLGINFTHVTGVDTTDADQLTAATCEARRQVEETIAVYRKYVPGMERCHLLSTPPTIGCRESRRILADLVLTKEDLMAERAWEDAIGYGSFFIDIHNTKGIGMDARTVHPRHGFKYQIPWRIQVPRGIDNLLTAGRCVSVTHEALGSLRVMPQCMVLGQAAGTACALSLAAGCTPRVLPVAQLQASLRAQDCILDAGDIARANRSPAPTATPQPRIPRAG